MKKLLWAILIVFIFTSAKAQQVTSVDCCVNVGSKAMIIINDNQTNAAAINLAAQSVVNKNGKCDFKLTVAANTSAGVYNAADNLIRTLWNGVRYDVGCYSLQWDGLLDDGTQAPIGSYNIKVLTNNVTYDWDIFANTTKGNNILKSYGGIQSIASTGNKVFFGHGFYEGEPTSRSFSASNIHDISYVDVGIGVINTGVATDGINVYWLGTDQYQNGGTGGNATNYIYATKVSDNSEFVFSAATQHPSGRPGTQKMVIGYYKDVPNNQYSGIAATHGASGFIFVSRADQNAVYVFNKQTGAIIKTVSITNPSLLSTAGTKLWIRTDNSLQLYNVDSSTGNLTATSVSIPNVNTQAFAVNNDGSLLKYADETTRTIKTYNGQTGAYISSFGRVNGYNGNPNVTNDAFSFYHDAANHCLTFSDDGSYWFNDPGNYRLMHYNAANVYLEQVDYIPSFRSINADPNNPTRVFIDELEYAIDYSKPLDNGTNGSWKLVKNWKENTNLDAFRRFTQVVTIAGKTLASGDNILYELVPDVGAVVALSNFDGQNSKIEADGSLYTRVNNNNLNVSVYKQPFLNYTSGNHPVWGNTVLVTTTPNFTSKSPYTLGPNNTRGASSNTGRYFFYNPDTNTDGYHLAGIKTGSNTWDWQTSKSTFFDYHGDYPRDGTFDIGNNDYSTQHSENCQLLVQGSDLFWNVNGEFWQANSGTSGVNIWNHYNEDGLLIGNFGVTSVEARNNGEKEMAGNSFSTAIVKVGADYYIYHCDENRWGSGHRWKVSGLNTIKEISIPVTVSAAINYVPTAGQVITGLPQRSTSFTGNSSVLVDDAPAGYTMRTSAYNDSFRSPDLTVGGSGTFTTRFPLNNSLSLTSWALSGTIGKPGSEPELPGGTNYNWFEVVDVAGKVIANYRDYADTRNGYYRYRYFNSATIASGSDADYAVAARAFSKFNLSYQNGALSFKLGSYPLTTVNTPYEAGADLSKPAFIRIRQAGNQNHYISLYGVTFVDTFSP